MHLLGWSIGRILRQDLILGVNVTEIAYKWHEPIQYTPGDIGITTTGNVDFQLIPDPIKINTIGPSICLNIFGNFDKDAKEVKFIKSYAIKLFVSDMSFSDPNIKMIIQRGISGDPTKNDFLQTFGNSGEIHETRVASENIKRLGDFLGDFDLSQKAGNISFCDRNHPGNNMFKLRRI